LGRNGAGKTTLFSLLTRFYKAPKNSEIMLFSLDINKHSHTIFKKIGIVFQQRTLDLDLSVRQNLMYFAQLHGLKKEQSISSIAKNLQTFGLLDVLNQKVRTLSGGQIRRIELVRSLLNQPENSFIPNTINQIFNFNTRGVNHLHTQSPKDICQQQ
jgi:ABC-2 type transport system ATP-binding protein